MKKLIYLPLLLLTLVVGVNKVNALSTQYFTYWYDHYDYLIDINENYSTVVNNLITYWETNFSSQYPYYIITAYEGFGETSLTEIRLYATTDNKLLVNVPTNTQLPQLQPYPYSAHAVKYVYNINTSEYSSSSADQFTFNHLPYSSNTSYTLRYDGTNDYMTAGSMQTPSWSDLSLDVSYPLTTINDGDPIPTYMGLTNGEPSADFTQVDMSDYDYIILSLKDYDTEPFNTTIYSLGRLCFTPVYDYGMTQKQDMYAGYQTAGCTEYYNSSTPVMIFIIQADIDNHAVYYIKRYNDETNVLNIPTSIFDITYITSANSSDPQVEIGGRSYPVLPYADLTDTANKSSEEGYISGRVCSLGDVNCQASATGMDISDLFTQPLKLLQSLWTSITSVFTIITTFITILPPILQTFLYVSFMLGIVIGIIKILL